jgi:hypothetical protein
VLVAPVFGIDTGASSIDGGDALLVGDAGTRGGSISFELLELGPCGGKACGTVSGPNPPCGSVGALGPDFGCISLTGVGRESLVIFGLPGMLV